MIGPDAPTLTDDEPSTPPTGSTPAAVTIAILTAVLILAGSSTPSVAHAAGLRQESVLSDDAEAGSQDVSAAGERAQDPDAAARAWLDNPEELDAALEKWADQYVRHLITERELEIYEALPSREQKLAFIERFWELRDPTPGSEKNEYRERHMERYAYATRMFAAGKPGWKTDRGRIYILLGAPNQIQRNPTGRGPMERASEVWTYNFIDNPELPATLDLSFVDFHGTGEYELVTDLDATAPLWSEQFGYVNSNLDAYALRRHADTLYDYDTRTARLQDPARLGFDYLEHFRTLREIEEVPEVHLERLRSLRESVEADVSFDAVGVREGISYFEGEGGETAVQVTVGISYDDLRHTRIPDGRHFSTDLYVALQRDDAVIGDDERRLNFVLREEEFDRLKDKRILQSFILSAAPGEYELTVMVRDNVARAVGRRTARATVPELSGSGLRLSSLTLASHVERVPAKGGDPVEEPFRHGDLRVIPNLGNAFYPDQSLFLYLQAYGLGLDAEESVNRISLRGRIYREGRRFREIPVQHPYPAPKDRMAFTLGVPLRDFRPGEYRVEVTVVDDVTGSSATASAPFRILGPSAADAR